MSGARRRRFYRLSPLISRRAFRTCRSRHFSSSPAFPLSDTPSGAAGFYWHATVMVMEVNTSRFGSIYLDAEDILCFPAGVLAWKLAVIGCS